ncbi:type II toxin-antitoxin system RelE/ParE family toxin [Atopobacter sp. AH10]|uniref:type II toxin-antitoxin system RelE/ParE family toxin n=1 Tax=Atopobacter sp. AH10 TaxID=2315861 RepID=UPI000EF211F2|nr:type II toxin-antitoxin system RelE/ParE family toxin [Atopobacter sp. AH10]RLK63920.1 type II toxin-antitoxin system RelE/ParE family toxin [Atopobacter sp. AH10]
MVNYTIEATQSAQKDLEAINRYLNQDLLSPTTALSFLEVFEHEMGTLCYIPQKFQLIHDDYFASKGYSLTRYKKYLIFYTISELETKVFIHRILHASRKWESLL